MYNPRASTKPLLTDFYENLKKNKTINAIIPLFSFPTVILNAAEGSTMCSRASIKACMKPGELYSCLIPTCMWNKQQPKSLMATLFAAALSSRYQASLRDDF